jgi:hypothetical protein
MFSRRLITILAVLAVAVAATASLAVASTSHLITPLSPKGKVAAGKDAKFKLRVKGPGSVFISVCTKAKKNKKGLICHNKDLVQAKRKKGTLFQATSQYGAYGGNWLNARGTYYWQAHRISCENGLKDCFQEGPVVKVKVR